MRNLNLKKGLIAPVLVAGTFVATAGCGTKGGGFSMLSTGQSFHQADAQINNKIDILWVIDNSGSMEPLQTNLNQNFSAFMSNFQSKGFDYQLGVTSTDAYLAAANYRNQASRAQLRDGANGNYSGIRIITPATVDPIATFVKNASLGVYGSGDERAFQSLSETLKSPLNTGFLRAGAFLAVVILSDEDDFSNPTRAEGSGDHDYNQAGLTSVSSLISELDGYTNSTATDRHYNVSAITIKDEACRAQHYQETTAAIVGQRYIDLANRTNGVLGSVCDASFANSLNFIQQRIVELSTQFKLDREPKPETISVSVNGSLVPNNATNGWTYSADTNTITFHGTAVPPASADLRITYDPKDFL